MERAAVDISKNHFGNAVKLTVLAQEVTPHSTDRIEILCFFCFVFFKGPTN